MRYLALDCWLLNQERKPAIRFFHLPIGQLGDEQFRRQRFRDSLQLTSGFKPLHKISKRVKRHFRNTNQNGGLKQWALPKPSSKIRAPNSSTRSPPVVTVELIGA